MRAGYRWRGRVVRPAMVKVRGYPVMAPQREWFEKDYYKVLGVSETATDKEIAQGLPQAGQAVPPRRQPRIRGALQGDLGRLRRARRQAKRKEYDEVRRSVPPETRSPGPARAGRWLLGGFRVDDLGDLLGNIFGRGGGRAGSGGGAGAVDPAVQRGQDLETSLHLSFLDAVNGITTTVNVTSEAACHTCGGTGAAPGTAPMVCPVCAAGA